MHSIIKTEGAPTAIGPYSQGIAAQAGTLVFVSGQIPLNPKTGDLVSEDISEQTLQVLRNLQAVLKAAHAELTHVTKTTIYLQDMGDFEKVNGIYSTFFPHNPPARATIQVAKLPKNAKVEIEAIAVLPLSK